MLRVLFIYTLYALANDLFVYFVLLPRTDSTKIYHFATSLFTVLEFLIFGGIIYFLNTGRLRRIVMLLGSIGFVFYCIWEYLESSDQPSFDSMPASIEAIMLIVFCIFFFFEELKKPPFVPVYVTNRFWIVIGIMVYTALIFFLFLQSAITPLPVFDSYWDINLIANILKNIIFAIAFVIGNENDVNQPKMSKIQSFKF
jgi:hypothetical protein